MSEKMFNSDELSDFHKKRVLDVAEMIKGGADMTPEGEVIVPDELQRQKRIEYYLESTKKEIEEMRAAGREEEAKIMEGRLKLFCDKWNTDPQHRIYDVFLFGERDEVIYNDVSGAKKEMDQVMFLRAEKVAMEKELKERSEQKRNKEMNPSWESIDFVKNLETHLDQGSLEDADIASFMKKLLVSDREEAGNVSGDEIRECYDTAFGSTANHTPEITEQHKRGLECLIGYQIPKDRLSSILYTYTPDRQLAAVVLTLKDAMQLAIRERQKPFINGGIISDRSAYEKAERDVEEEFRDKKDPFLGEGSLIIKKDGTRYFILQVTWKQYPTATPSGRIVMTFAGGASRGIFDEEVCYTSSYIRSSTGKRTFSVKDPDAYDWDDCIKREGGITAYDGKVLPPAKMKFDEVNDVILVGVDWDDEDGSRIRSNLE